MSWRNWPSWLKGGVIGAGVGVLVVFIYFLVSTSYFVDNTNFNLNGYLIHQFFGYFSMIPIGFFMSHTLASLNIHLSYAFFISNCVGTVVNFFLIGTLIGLIIGKFKSKKKRK